MSESNLEDRAAIHDLFTRYFCALDNGEIEAVVDCFTVDAMVSNIAVTITGNRATASAYLLVLISENGNHRSPPPGRYACELIKEDSGQWRFSRRTVFHDHDYTLDRPPPVPPTRSPVSQRRAGPTRPACCIRQGLGRS
jgi:hypothetical protein